MEWLKLNLFKKVIAVFFIAIIPLLIIGVALNQTGTTIIQRDIEESMHSRVQFYMNSFETEMDRIIRMKQQYTVDNDIQTLVMHHMILSDIDLYYTVLEVQRKLMQFKEASLFVEGVRLYVPELDMRIDDVFIERGIASTELTELEQKYGRMELITAYGDQLIMMDSYPKSILRDNEPQIYLEVELSKQKIEQTLRTIIPNKLGETVIWDLNGRWHLGTLPSDMEGLRRLLDDQPQSHDNAYMDGRVELDRKPHLYAYQLSPRLGAALMIYVDESELLGPLHWHKRLFWILAATSVCVILLFSLWIYRLIHKPMYMLTSAFRRVEKGDLTVVHSYDKRDEFRYLYRQLAQLTARLKGLTEDIYEQELRLNRTELKQLQAQINPHFLYNIFFLLNRVLKLEDVETAKKLTVHLGKYFQYMTRNSRDEVSLLEEVEHIRSYTSIQSLRFGSKLSVELEQLPSEVQDVKVPRLILQPLVENAFEYGLEDNPEKGRLRIGYEAGTHSMEVQIEDNGIGLTDEKLLMLGSRLTSLEADRKLETTGILNVHRRLQLRYGEGYGLTLQRSRWGGLLVKLRMPVLPALEQQGGDDNHEQIIDCG
ncbi:histidine kinase [Paenibacillus sp. J5C_2022]|uniref:sensor histidine kinase n=1 Tax=Paenibacillus sp. J5C2022 TaxID=2977129 RepID=UPI0021D25134|nr:histidine kinase [Paenibacillus sp. J5C2022]MCU6707722.1 histidine kinase [Paenibacillus sp. J5C2022]